MDVMKAARLAAAVALALAAVAAGEARADAVKIAKHEKAGSYLTDAKGMALYVFKKDSPGKSACTGECVAKWPPYYREKVDAGAGVKESDFATITREDGQKQTTYKGMPLYYFAGDKAPADTSGQGVRDVWFLAQP